jgi:hypothetical protein
MIVLYYNYLFATLVSLVQMVGFSFNDSNIVGS